jgi:hypothetical protein
MKTTTTITTPEQMIAALMEAAQSAGLDAREAYRRMEARLAEFQPAEVARLKRFAQMQAYHLTPAEVRLIL